MELFKKLGLTNIEIKVYQALIELHEAPIGEIIARSGVPSSHIYKAIDSLTSIGLISYSIRKKRKFYKITSKEALKEIIESKREDLKKVEDELEKALPSLFDSKLSASTGEIIVYEGIPGIKASINNMLSTLNKGDTYYVLGAPAIINNRLNGFFLDIHHKRVEKGIKYRIIYNQDDKEFAKQRVKQKLTDVAIQQSNSSVEIAIYKDTVQFVFLDKKYRLIEIKNENLAKTMLIYFDLVWTSAHKI